MDLSQLFYFIPAIAAIFLVYHLIFKVQLPSKGIGGILSYIFGAVIIFAVVGYLISTYFGSWMNTMLNAGKESEWTTFVNSSENIVEGAFGTEGNPSNSAVTAVTPAAASDIIITATPAYIVPGGGSYALETDPVVPGSATTHTVQPGDTLYSIATQYGVSVDAIMIANGMTSYLIMADQVLQIPAPQ